MINRKERNDMEKTKVFLDGKLTDLECEELYLETISPLTPSTTEIPSTEPGSKPIPPFPNCWWGPKPSTKEELIGFLSGHGGDADRWANWLKVHPEDLEWAWSLYRQGTPMVEPIPVIPTSEIPPVSPVPPVSTQPSGYGSRNDPFKLNQIREKGGYTGQSVVGFNTVEGYYTIPGHTKIYVEVDPFSYTGFSIDGFEVHIMGFNNFNLKYYAVVVNKATGLEVRSEYLLPDNGDMNAKANDTPVRKMDEHRYLYAVDNTGDRSQQLKIWWA
jgi:hypothetical protein